jgi:DNA adenine methylase
LLPNISVIDDVEEELCKYIEENFHPKNVKLIVYPGGDYYIFEDLNEVFMRVPFEKGTFVEVFGGSCWCSLNVSRKKFENIVANDIDSLLMNLYKAVKENPEEVMKKLSVIPFSREIHKIAKEIIKDQKADPLIKSIMLFYLLRTSIFGKGGFAIAKKPNRWTSYSISFLKSISAIKEYAKKLRDVILENRDYRDIIKRYDSSYTLFYLDPPYISTEKSQGREGFFNYSFKKEDMIEMATVLKNIKGYWVLKLSEDNYNIIKDYLPNHEVKIVEKTQNFKKVNGEKRPKWKLVISYNYKLNEKSLLSFIA